MASATNCGLESKAESSIRMQKKYGHLQFCVFDVMFSVGNGVRNPQNLGHHSSSTHDPTVKHRRELIGSSDDEGAAISFQTIRSRDRVAFQNVREESFGWHAPETMGYITVNENLWVVRIGTEKRDQSQLLTEGEYGIFVVLW